jgi:lipid A ethanolaminephosphotransferase
MKRNSGLSQRFFSGATAKRRAGFAAGAIFTALWWTLVFCAPFWRELWTGVKLGAMSTEAHVAASAVLGSAFLLLSVAIIALLALLPQKLFKAVMIVLAGLGATGFAAAVLYNTVMTPDMMRSFLESDPAEASGYLSLRTIVLWLAVFVPPVAAALLMHTRPVDIGGIEPSGFAVRRPKCVLALVALVTFAAAAAIVFLNFQTCASVMRGDRQIRYRIAPFNIVYSSIRTVTKDESPDGKRVRAVIDPAPKQTVKPERPVVFVVAIGETMRSANWGLSGYARDTSPELRSLNVINFPRVESCGTSTDVSLPCMMSRIGRENYDRERILSEESLPDVLQRAGMNVLWIDNQSGCKGACAGVPHRKPQAAPELCGVAGCQDGAVRADVGEIVKDLKPGRPTVLFLHMIGQHGPAYYKRSPASFKIWKPECEDADLASCSRESILNAYDNSVRYTDSVLAGIIRDMEASGADAGLIYVSDHGESLGENGIYLHGAPFMIAPDEQKHVPMVLWLSKGFEEDYGVDEALLRERAAKDDHVTHDSLYHTVLGLLKVQSSTYQKRLDLSAK